MLTRLKFLTAGESHGQGLLGILDGMPAGLEISEEYIGVHLARRQMGHGRGGRMKIEKDYKEDWGHPSAKGNQMWFEVLTNYAEENKLW